MALMTTTVSISRTVALMSSKATNTAFLTTEEVLTCLKVTPRTIYRLIQAGELPAVRIGRQWRFRRADLDEWINRQRTATS
jgi:excisionase family DNA binding protein